MCVCCHSLVSELYIVEIWGRDPWLPPIEHSHLVLIFVVMLLGQVASIEVIQEKWDDDVWSKYRFLITNAARW